MYHRYGRHGPHAWLKWRKRHLQQHLPDAPQKTRTIVIYVQIPVALTERILIVADPDTTFQSDGFDSIRKELRQRSFGHGKSQAKEDISNCADILVEQELQAHASGWAEDYVLRETSLASLRGMTMEEASPICTEGYIAGYQEVASPITTYAVRAIWLQARQDKQQDDDHGFLPTSWHIDCRAIIRASQNQKAEDLWSADYFTGVTEYAKCYQDFYNRIRARKGGAGQLGPVGFSGNFSAQYEE